MGEMDELLTHLVFLARRLRGFEKRHIVEIFLLEMGVSTNTNSFSYLVDAILIYQNTPDPLVTKDVYPDVAKKHKGTNAIQIERSVRRAITQAWISRNEKWTMYFQNGYRPTNGEFISRLAKILDLWEDCRRAVAREEESNADARRDE